MISRAAQIFLEHCEPHPHNEDTLRPYKFYERKGEHPNYSAEDLKRYEKWLRRCYSAIKEATRAANWFADVVRRDINPMFFAIEGKFPVVEGPLDDLSYRIIRLEFEEGEKEKLPDSLLSSDAPKN